MGDVGDRLGQARKRAKLSRAEVAAKLGMSYSTVASHENGQTDDPPRDTVKRYVKLYKASLAWVLTGEGPVDAQNLVPLVGRIGAGGDIDPEYEQVPEDGLDEIELPINVGVDAVAFEVSGTSMKPRYDQGVLIICTRASRDPEVLIGTEVAVRTSDNKRYLKTLRHGRKRGLFTLESFNADPIPDVRLAWVGEILAVIPAHRRVATAMQHRRTG
jgi:phage repressor protein C with HTH and peptisase S24 domain